MNIVRPLLALVCLATASAKDANPPAAAEKGNVLVLEPMKVQENPVISFSVDITVYAQPDTRKVNRIFIARVLPDGDADKAGLKAGDEIVKIDGVAVKEYDAVISTKSPLGRVLLNRDPGEPLKLEVITRRTEQFTLRAQRGLPFIR